MALVDLHCHILPGVDDGALDVADAVAMARQAADDGIEVVCATPHIRHDHDVRIGELRDRVARLNVALAALGVPVAVATGGEVAETAADRLDETELAQVSLNGHGRWVLIEPAPGPLSDSLMSVIGRLGDRGARAVIAHPERHLGPMFRERLTALVSAGALVQVTAALVLDPDGGPALGDLAAAGLVHLVASDAHSARWGRPVAISAAIAHLTERAGRDLGAFMADAPAALLRGEDVEPPQAATMPTGA
jgi:protein-tyrosine phosphatase